MSSQVALPCLVWLPYPVTTSLMVQRATCFDACILHSIIGLSSVLLVDFVSWTRPVGILAPVTFTTFCSTLNDIPIFLRSWAGRSRHVLYSTFYYRLVNRLHCRKTFFLNCLVARICNKPGPPHSI